VSKLQGSLERPCIQLPVGHLRDGIHEELSAVRSQMDDGFGIVRGRIREEFAVGRWTSRSLIRGRHLMTRRVDARRSTMNATINLPSERSPR
jgi:hypothetical protein